MRFVVAAAFLLIASPLMAQQADEAQVRQSRAAMNKAFAARDMTTLTSFLTDRITWAGPAWRIVGKEQFEKNHKGYWAMRPDVTWDYTPSRIVPFSQWHWLSEEGTWEQNWTAEDGRTQLRGTYLTFWQRGADGKWLADAHLFITTSCAPAERAFCRRDTRQPVTR